MTTAATHLERVFREEHGRILATLIRVFGDFDLAEDALQLAFVEAAEHWPVDGIPDSPRAWLITAARRRGLDRIRRERTQSKLREQMEHEPEAAPMEPSEPDLLRLIFTCCHPALNLEAQVALTLRTVGGLTTTEVARAFLQTEPTVAQRLVRAKKKIREAHIPYAIPADDVLAERLSSVLAVVYLVFNEGYSATEGDALIRHELCAEAIRLGRMLIGLIPSSGDAHALLALMLLQDSRRDARMRDGELVVLEDQDRALWDRRQIEQGLAMLDRAIALNPGPPSAYHLQAAIAAMHAHADSAASTDWEEISALYAGLQQILDTPVVRLNRAVAVAMARGPDEGLRMIDAAGLEGYHLLHSARADLLRRAGRRDAAIAAYERALELCTNAVERRFLEKRIATLLASTS